MNEACLNLYGEGISSKVGHDFSVRVMDYMRDVLVEFQEETGHSFNLEATPAEGTSFRLAKLDKKHYPGILCCNEEEFANGKPPLYTNSTQLPVNYTNDMFDLLDKQDEIQAKYTGGTVQHLYIGEKIDDTVALKNLIRKICDNYQLPYFSITPTFSVCPNCGYISGEVHECPTCNEKTEVYSRVVGYLRPVNQWNEGKSEEFKMRKTFEVC